MRVLIRSLLAVSVTAAMLFLAGCASLVPPPGGKGAAVSDSAEPRAEWSRVLARFVDAEGRVNFAALARDRADLDRYVAWVYRVGPNNRPELFAGKDQVLAYHINAYNALAMYAVLDDGLPASLTGLKKVSFFFLKRLQVGGQTLSLHAYESDLIRPLGDPRLHFALNCMSVGCPKLPREAFDGGRLQMQLERETRAFFAEPRNLRVDAANRAVYLSEILKFYPEDFLAVAPSLLAYANRYAPQPVPLDYQVKFTPYDWTVNHQPAGR